MAFGSGFQMQHNDEGNAWVRRHRSEELRQSSEPACRRSDRDDRDLPTGVSHGWRLLACCHGSRASPHGKIDCKGMKWCGLRRLYTSLTLNFNLGPLPYELASDRLVTGGLGTEQGSGIQAKGFRR